VTLTAPADGSVYVAPANINLTASVATNGHSIQKVQFYNGANLLAEVHHAAVSIQFQQRAAWSLHVRGGSGL
jgi:hypothetical protein